MAVFASTLRALGAPRRLLPVVLVGLALVLVQASYSRDARAAVVPLAMTLGFVLAAPATWRLLLARTPGAPVGLLVFAAQAVLVVWLAGSRLPAALGLGATFLTDSGSLLVAVVLYLVGGWGLGRDIELERDLEHTRVLALRTHLDPHFLYNTLNAIAEWCREDPRLAEEAILRLSSMLEGVFSGLEVRSWPLARELALVEYLVALHRVRDPGKLSLELSVTGSTDGLEVPPLALLLLVENAIKHGARKDHHGPIGVQVTVEAARVLVVVENPGPYQPGRPGRGLVMLRRQLDGAYGAAARLDLAAAGERTRATLSLPRRLPR